MRIKNEDPHAQTDGASHRRGLQGTNPADNYNSENDTRITSDVSIPAGGRVYDGPVMPPTGTISAAGSSGERGVLTMSGSIQNDAFSTDGMSCGRTNWMARLVNAVVCDVHGGNGREARSGAILAA